ncbi:MAG: DUF4321 domain-containing protein [Firmicutes bacterium]|nr:DUF4321 domain-containing protein [Bacillota bacterium]
MGIAVVYVLLGGLVGSLMGHLLAPLWTPLGRTLVFLGTPPVRVWSVNLGIVGFQVGAWLNVNVLGIVGLLAGLAWFQRRSAG